MIVAQNYCTRVCEYRRLQHLSRMNLCRCQISGRNNIEADDRVPGVKQDYTKLLSIRLSLSFYEFLNKVLCLF